MHTITKSIFTVRNFAANLTVTVECLAPGSYRVKCMRYGAEFPTTVLVEGTEQKAIDVARSLAYTKNSRTTQDKD